MEKKTRELTEKEQMDINGGSVHTTLENGDYGSGGGSTSGLLGALVNEMLGGVQEYLKP